MLVDSVQLEKLIADRKPGEPLVIRSSPELESKHEVLNLTPEDMAIMREIERIVLWMQAIAAEPHRVERELMSRIRVLSEKEHS